MRHRTEEIEDIRIGHPGVADIAIVGVPDAGTGGEPAPSSSPPTRRAATWRVSRLLAVPGCRDLQSARTGSYWEAPPRNEAGKVLKHQIGATLREVDG